jgi:hypothetical protein
VAVVGDLEHRERMPRIGDDRRLRQREPPQQRQDHRDDHDFAADHGKPHRRDRLGNPRDRKEEHLRHGRVGGDRIVGAVDIRIDRAVAQRGERRVGRHVEVGIDPGSLHPAVPDVAIEISRQQRLDADEHEPHPEREAEHDHQAGSHRHFLRQARCENRDEARGGKRRNEDLVVEAAHDPWRGGGEAEQDRPSGAEPDEREVAPRRRMRCSRHSADPARCANFG